MYSQPHHISRSRQATLKLDTVVIAGMCENLDFPVGEKQGSPRGFRGVSASERSGRAWGSGIRGSQKLHRP